MTVADLKLKIFREVDSLEKSRLEELYGVIINFLNGQKDIGDWDKLTEEQKRGIGEAIDEIDKGAGVSHEKLMAKMRKKFSHA
jgi:hypothetical protein